MSRPGADQLTLDGLGTPLRDVTFVVVDLETTGGSAQADAITEIGAVKVRSGEVLGEFATLVDPGRGIPPQIVSLTGITDMMVTRAPTIDTVLPAFLEFAAGSVLVAHNSGFDIGFLRAACTHLGAPWPKPTVLCTARLARRVLSRDEAPTCRLSFLAEILGARARPVHRALADARATVDVLHALLERVGPLGVHSLEELLGYLPEVTPEQRRKRHLASDLPTGPGVYLFRGPGDEVLYVGTSGNLRSRVRTYFTGGEGRRRIREMVAIAQRVDSVSCAHALEARVRELRLLEAHRPPYNRRSKDPRRIWWVVLTDESFPRLSVVRAARPGALGPFTSHRSATAAVEAIGRVVRLRTCTTRIPVRDPRGTPCALAEIDRCGAPCSGSQSVDGYRPEVDRVRDLIGGRDDTLLSRLAQAVDEYARTHRYEAAAARRDQLGALVRALERGQRLASLAAVPELVAASPDHAGGWHLAVVRHGRLAAAGNAPPGVPPMPVVDMLQASAETVLPGPGPLAGGSYEELHAVGRWLVNPGTRLVRTAVPWAEPARGAGPWQAWGAHGGRH